jgi:putative transcriptional regulator
MSDQTLSIADRWMRRYEQEHPEVLKQVTRKSHSHNRWQPVARSVQSTPSQPSKTRNNASLWNTFPEDTAEQRAPTVTDPVVLAAIQARKSLKLTQAKFARCLGISPRTVSEWEQGRRQPSGAARTLLHWVAERPEDLKQALKKLQRPQ